MQSDDLSPKQCGNRLPLLFRGRCDIPHHRIRPIDKRASRNKLAFCDRLLVTIDVGCWTTQKCVTCLMKTARLFDDKTDNRRKLLFFIYSRLSIRGVILWGKIPGGGIIIIIINYYYENRCILCIFEDQIEVIRILNEYENSDKNMRSHLRKILQLEDTR